MKPWYAQQDESLPTPSPSVASPRSWAFAPPELDSEPPSGLEPQSNIWGIDWDAVDGIVFDKIWPDRPWSKCSRMDTPGGESHASPRQTLSPRVSQQEPGLPATKPASPAVRAPPVEAAEFAVEYSLYAAFAEPMYARAFKVRIRNDSTFALVQTLVKRGSIPEDFSLMKRDFFKSADEPCYVLFLAAPLSGLWAFFAYVPDTAPFHERMLYMAGGAQLLAMLGGEARMPWQTKWTSLDEVVYGPAHRPRALSQPPTPQFPSAPQQLPDDTIEVQVPEGCHAGSSFIINLPDGRQIEVDVPQGCGPGTRMLTVLPPAKPPPRMNSPSATSHHSPANFQVARMEANLDALTDIERNLIIGQMESRERAEQAAARQVAVERAAARDVYAAARPPPPPKGSAPVAKSTSVGLQLPISTAADSALRQFIDARVGACVLAVEGEELGLRYMPILRVLSLT